MSGFNILYYMYSTRASHEYILLYYLALHCYHKLKYSTTTRDSTVQTTVM